VGLGPALSRLLRSVSETAGPALCAAASMIIGWPKSAILLRRLDNAFPIAVEQWPTPKIIQTKRPCAVPTYDDSAGA